MIKKNKKKLVAIILLSIFVFSIYSGYDAEHHPYIMPSYPNMLNRLGMTDPNTPGHTNVIFMNITPYANSVQIGFLGYILGNSNNTIGYTEFAGHFGGFHIWIGDENLHEPFTAATLLFNSFTLATNGTVFHNFTSPNGTVFPDFTGSYNSHNIISLMNVRQCFYLPTIGPNGGILTDGQPIGVYEYCLNNGPNLSPYYAFDMKPGNYTYWANLTVTPILFMGPNYFPTNPITLTLVFKQNYAPLPYYYAKTLKWSPNDI
ncbi:MAG: hypothetical protein ACYDAO_07600 [Thermoplasmataceae archaeon]